MILRSGPAAVDMRMSHTHIATATSTTTGITTWSEVKGHGVQFSAYDERGLVSLLAIHPYQKFDVISQHRQCPQHVGVIPLRVHLPQLPLILLQLGNLLVD